MTKSFFSNRLKKKGVCVCGGGGGLLRLKNMLEVRGDSKTTN